MSCNWWMYCRPDEEHTNGIMLYQTRSCVVCVAWVYHLQTTFFNVEISIFGSAVVSMKNNEIITTFSFVQESCSLCNSILLYAQSIFQSLFCHIYVNILNEKKKCSPRKPYRETLCMGISGIWFLLQYPGFDVIWHIRPFLTPTEEKKNLHKLAYKLNEAFGLNYKTGCASSSCLSKYGSIKELRHVI